MKLQVTFTSVINHVQIETRHSRHTPFWPAVPAHVLSVFKEEKTTFKEETTTFKEETATFKEETTTFKEETTTFKEETATFKEETAALPGLGPG